MTNAMNKSIQCTRVGLSFHALANADASRTLMTGGKSKNKDRLLSGALDSMFQVGRAMFELLTEEGQGDLQIVSQQSHDGARMEQHGHHRAGATDEFHF